MRTLVFQSWRSGAGPAWVRTCLASVEAWAEARGHAHQLIGDELFDGLPRWYRDKTVGHPIIAADLARLLTARDLLASGDWDRVVWLDADVLVFDPDRLVLPPTPYAFGREVWVQRDARGKLKAYRKVHNALCVFERGNPVLDFLAHATESLVGRYQEPLPPTVVGPRLLGHLHNLVQFPLAGSVGSLGPLVLRDVLAGGGEALALHRAQQDGPLCAANLCASMVADGHDEVRLDEGQMTEACRLLTRHGRRWFGAPERVREER